MSQLRALSGIEVVAIITLALKNIWFTPSYAWDSIHCRSGLFILQGENVNHILKFS